MRKIFTLLVVAMAAVVSSRGEIAFRLLPVTSVDGLDASFAVTIDQKLATAFTRLEALNETPDWALVVEPVIDIQEAVMTEGMIREVGRVKADLVLTAKNAYDGHTFATVTIPLTATAVGGEAKVLKSLAAQLKPTAPAFVRFVKQSRTRITDYYAKNCGSILTQAQTLASTGRADAAYSLLSAIDPSLDCYDAASAMMVELHPLLSPTVEEPVEPAAPVVEEEPAAAPVVETAPAPEPVVEEPAAPVEVKEPEPAPAPALRWTATVKSSAPDKWKVQLRSIELDKENGRLIIVVAFRNIALPYDNGVGMRCRTIVYGNGDSVDGSMATINGHSGASINAPYGVDVNVRIVVNGYGETPRPISIIQIDCPYSSMMTISDIHTIN